MRTIYKYPIEIQATQYIPVDRDLVRFLTVQMQGSTPTVWVELDTNLQKPTDQTKILVRGTGHPFSGEEVEYIGTVQSGYLVWHIYTGK